MNKHDTIAELKAKLDLYPSAGRSVNYPVQMWRIALSAAAEGVDPRASAGSDAIPYVPFVPEDIGLVLTSKSRMLDLGCLGGYGMFDFARRRRAEGRGVPGMVGADIDPDSVRIGRELAEIWAPGEGVVFQEANAESLPFEDSSFDFVVARLLLPCVRVQPAMAGMARVLKPGGVLFVQHHSFPYYWNVIFNKRKDLLGAFRFFRPIMSGVWYAFTRRQPSHRWFAEIPLTPRWMDDMGLEMGLKRVWRGGFPTKPLVAFRKNCGLRSEGGCGLWDVDCGEEGFSVRGFRLA